MAEDVVTLFHNPSCGTSRTVLGMLRDAGYQPEVIEYLRTGWTREQLTGLLSAMRVGPRAVLRSREPLASELGLLSPDVPDHHLLEAMVAHPVLVERPIVASARGAVLARPADRVWELLTPTLPD